MTCSTTLTPCATLEDDLLVLPLQNEQHLYDRFRVLDQPVFSTHATWLAPRSFNHPLRIVKVTKHVIASRKLPVRSTRFPFQASFSLSNLCRPPFPSGKS